MEQNKESLSFIEQVQRYWTILVTIIGIGVGMQLQINSNATHIDALLEFKKQSEPLYLKSLEMQAEIKGDLKSVQIDMQNTNKNQERLLREVQELNSDIRDIYKEKH